MERRLRLCVVPEVAAWSRPTASAGSRARRTRPGVGRSTTSAPPSSARPPGAPERWLGQLTTQARRCPPASACSASHGDSNGATCGSSDGKRSSTSCTTAGQTGNNDRARRLGAAGVCEHGGAQRLFVGLHGGERGKAETAELVEHAGYAGVLAEAGQQGGRERQYGVGRALHVLQGVHVVFQGERVRTRRRRCSRCSRCRDAPAR